MLDVIENVVSVTADVCNIVVLIITVYEILKNKRSNRS